MMKYLKKPFGKLARGINYKGLSGNGIIAAVREKIWFYNIARSSDLKDYQKNDMREFLKILYKYFRNPKIITVLNVGCSAAEAKYLARHVRKVAGINIDDGSLGIDFCPKNVKLLVMDGTRLDFAEKTFDFVCSVNLYEHVRDLSKCIDEQLRVLKDDGYCYASWAPIWSGPKGHHIHDDMVRGWEADHKLEPTSYKNDGQFIKDWSHLLLSKSEMFEYLLPRLKSRELVQDIVKYIYVSSDLNRLFFDEVEKIFSEKDVRIVLWEKSLADIPAETLNALRGRYPHSDYRACNSRILFARATANPTTIK